MDDYDVKKWNEMSPEDRQKILDIAAQIDITDSQSVINAAVWHKVIYPNFLMPYGSNKGQR